MRGKGEISMCRRDFAGEHPLEALYQARDAAQQAASKVHYTDNITPADRASYEHVLGGLLQAVGALSHLCQLPEDRSGCTSGAGCSQAGVEYGVLPDVEHPNSAPAEGSPRGTG